MSKSDSKLVVKIVNSSDHPKTSVEKEKSPTIENVKETSNRLNFDINSLHKTDGSEKKFNLYENFLKCASRRSNGRCADVEQTMSRLSLSNENSSTSRRCPNVSSTQRKSENNHRNSRNPFSKSKQQVKSERGEVNVNASEEFEFSNQNEFWEEDDFLLTIGQNTGHLKTEISEE